jgi:hypothetical protein
MNNIYKLFTEIFFTLVVAFILSLLFSFFLYFIFANLGISDKMASYVNFGSGIVFGLAVGYRLNDLLNRKKKKTWKLFK